jgi:hypothetical protein
MIKFTRSWWLSIFMLLLSSCTQYAYYQSPFQSNTASYKTMPLYSDSIRSAIYANATFTTGGANYNYRDGINGGIASIYRTHTSRNIQAFYGLTGTLGNYHVKPYVGDAHNKNLDTTSINDNAGSKFFGGWGATGGFNLNIPFAKHEWRIGTELSWEQEFGKLLDFRRHLPGTAANLIGTSKNYMTVALTSDLVFHMPRGAAGYKIAVVKSLSRLHGFDREQEPYSLSPAYVSNTFHVTVNHLTGFSQINFGTYSMSIQLGINYRLHKR